MKFLGQNSFQELLNQIKLHFIRKSEAEEAETADIVEASTIDIDTSPTTSSTNLVTSGGVKTAIDAKYTKPWSGIPKSDLSSDVQQRLTKVTYVSSTHCLDIQN